MFGDVPTPNFGFDDPGNPCPMLYSPGPSGAHTLTKQESQELFELHGFTIVTDTLLRCPSNSSVYVAASASDGRLWAVKITSNH
jgi:hypothetical protein